MNISLLRCLAIAFAVCALTGLLSGCVSTGGYYDDGGIGAAYYEPPDVVYGGWGPGYHVAPYRGDDHRDHHPTSGGGRTSERAYRSAPASHSAPSIPSQPRSGGSRSGGSHSSGSHSH
jgi:hypothetical protein